MSIEFLIPGDLQSFASAISVFSFAAVIRLIQNFNLTSFTSESSSLVCNQFSMLCNLRERDREKNVVDLKQKSFESLQVIKMKMMMMMRQ